MKTGGKKLVVMTSPFTGGNQPRDQNIIYARLCLADCLKRNEAPLAGHILYTQQGIFEDEQMQRELAIAAEHAWLTACDYVVVYKDHGMSPGMVRCIERAKYLMLGIVYRSLNESS